MTSINEPISDQAFHRLLTIMRLGRQHARQLSDEQGIRPQEHSLLRYLLENGDATIGQLQQYLHKSPSTVSALVAKLEGENLVSRKRSAEDNRVVNVTVTSIGRERALNTPLAGYPLLRRRLATLPPLRQAEINDVLAEILKLMGGEEDA